MIDTLNIKDKECLKRILSKLISCKKKDVIYVKTYNSFCITITTPISRGIKDIIPQLFKGYLSMKGKNLFISANVDYKMKRYDAPRFTISIVLKMFKIIKKRSKEYLRVL